MPFQDSKRCKDPASGMTKLEHAAILLMASFMDNGTQSAVKAAEMAVGCARQLFKELDRQEPEKG